MITSKARAMRAPLTGLGALAALVAAAAVLARLVSAGAPPGLATQDLTQGLTAQDLAATLVGEGITVSNVSYTGAGAAAGTFSGGSGIIGFQSGIILSSGAVASVVGPNTFDSTSTENLTPGDADLDTLSGFTTFDAAVLEFDFVPSGDAVAFNYVFASEEYNEFVHQEFNDVFAFFVNGVNCATVGGAPVSINSINNGNPFGTDPRERPELYLNNDLDDGGGAVNTEMDGLTVVLSCRASVSAGATNHIKLAVADASDGVYDANVFLQAESFVVPPTATPTVAATPTNTLAPTETPTTTPEATTPVATATPISVASPTATGTATRTSTRTPTRTPTAVPTFTRTATGTATRTPSATPFRTPTPTRTPAPSPTSPPTFTPTATATDTATPADTPPPAIVRIVLPPTDTPTRTATPTATSTATSAPTPTATLTSEVLATGPEPPSGEPEAEGPESTAPGPEGIGGAILPRTSGLVLGLDQISTDPRVIGTNIVLAIILLLVLLFTSTLFNETVGEHRVQIQAFAMRLTRPFRAVGGGLATVSEASPWLERVVGPVLILALTGLVYSLNEPDFGWNSKTLLLFSSLVVAVGLTTYVYEGGEALITSRRFQVPAAVRLFPVALAIAGGFVLLSRLADFQAPIIYGFVASSTVLAVGTLDRRQSAQAVFFPAVALLGLSIGAWFLLIPLREAGQDSNEWWAHLPGETAALLFAGGIEGLLFTMIPVRFTDGGKIFHWNRLLWLPLFAVPAFLFSWVIVNPEAKELDALTEGRVIVVLSLVAAYATLVVATWAFFVLRGGEGPPPERKMLPPGPEQSPAFRSLLPPLQTRATATGEAAQAPPRLPLYPPREEP